MQNSTNLMRAVAVSFLISVPVLAAGSDWDAEQARLDAACEAAREAKLAPLRAQYIEECVQKQQRPDRASCERFYADFGNRSGNRPPLFYDLPECVAAHEHRKTRD
jgi:hypothetical protein